MPQGRLGTAVLTANTPAVLFTAPANCLYMEVDVSALNRTANTDATLKLAIAAADTPTPDEWIEDGKIVAASGGTYDATSLKLSPGERVVAQANVALSMRVSGKPVTRLSN
jgi:hypothetical protein